VELLALGAELLALGAVIKVASWDGVRYLNWTEVRWLENSASFLVRTVCRWWIGGLVE